MTYDQILTLDMIIKHGSFKSASSAMNKSQPSLSMAIKKLEEEYQITIFNRDQYRPVLTESGKAFYEKSKAALETFDELHTFGRELSQGLETEINLSIDAICPIYELAPIFESFFQPHITTGLNLSIDLLEGLIQRIESHNIDFAIGSLLKPKENIVASPLFKIKMIPVIAPKHINEQDNLKKTLRKIPQIILTSSSSNKGQDIIGSLSRSKQWFTSDILMKEQLITSGLGWGRLPKHLIGEHLANGKLSEIKSISDVPSFDVDMYLLKSKTKVLGPTAKRLWEYFSTKYKLESRV